MRDLILKVRLTDEEAARYEGRDAMVIPVSDEDVAELGLSIIGVHELLAALAAELASGDTSPRAMALRAAAGRMG